MPESYGTFSHLWASVVHESARARPSTRSRRPGAAAAHSPNAPSTWSQAFGVGADGGRDLGQRIEGARVHVARLGAHDDRAGRARPASRAGRRRASGPARRPAPDGRGRGPGRASGATRRSSRATRRRRRRRSVARRPGRPPRGPSRRRSRTRWRAAARAVKLAIVAPVVNPTLEPAGSPNRSTSQPAATSSTTDAAGDRAYRPPFWSQVLVSQSAARAAGHRPADHEPEVARTGGRDEAGPGVAGQRSITTSAGASPSAGSGPAERGPQRGQVHGRPDRPIGECLEEVGRQGGGGVQQGRRCRS